MVLAASYSLIFAYELTNRQIDLLPSLVGTDK